MLWTPVDFILILEIVYILTLQVCKENLNFIKNEISALKASTNIIKFESLCKDNQMRSPLLLSGPKIHKGYKSKNVTL